jgi:hypothetical protein
VKTVQYQPPQLSAPIEFKYDMTKPTTLLGKLMLSISSFSLGTNEEKKPSAEDLAAQEAALAAAMNQPSVVSAGATPSAVLPVLPIAAPPNDAVTAAPSAPPLPPPSGSVYPTL